MDRRHAILSFRNSSGCCRLLCGGVLAILLCVPLFESSGQNVTVNLVSRQGEAIPAANVVFCPAGAPAGTAYRGIDQADGSYLVMLPGFTGTTSYLVEVSAPGYRSFKTDYRKSQGTVLSFRLIPQGSSIIVRHITDGPNLSITLDTTQVVPEGVVHATFLCVDPEARSSTELQFRYRLTRPSATAEGIRHLQEPWSEWLRCSANAPFSAGGTFTDFGEEGVYEIEAECRNTRTRRESGTVTSAFAVAREMSTVLFPDGQWVSAQPAGNAASPARLWVPDFIDNGPQILDIGGNASLHRGRRDLWCELFIELLLQSGGRADQCSIDFWKPLVLSLSEGRNALDVIRHARLAETRSILGSGFASQLIAMAEILAIAGAADHAEVEVLLAYFVLQAFQEARYKSLNQLMSQTRQIDPEMRVGLSDAYRRISEDRQRHHTMMLSAARRGALINSGGSVLLQMLGGSAAGPALRTFLGSPGVGRRTPAVPAGVWFRPLLRTTDPTKAVAVLVLLSTLDRGLLSHGHPMPFVPDRYVIEQMRSHMLWMGTEGVRFYRDHANISRRARERMGMWVHAHQHYDQSHFELLVREAEMSLGLISAPSAGEIAGTVVDATSGSPLPGAAIALRSPDGVFAPVTSDQEGRFVILGIRADMVEVSASAEGYISDTQSLRVVDNHADVQFALAPVSRGVEFRVVLSWGSTPRDLDAHLLKENVQIWYQNRGNDASYPHALLDVDDTDGNGPETISITSLDGENASYYVHQFSGDGQLSHSEAVVKVYSGDRLIRTFNVFPSGDERWWHVFDITREGMIIDRDEAAAQGPVG